MSSSTESAVNGVTPVVRRVRAYFAPVNRMAGVPVLFDAATCGRFDLDSPPAPWIDLGWIEGFTRKSASTVGVLATGAPAAPLTQVREQLEARVAFRFKQWGKLSMALSCGSQHMNLLTPGISPTALVAGSTATFLAMSAADAGTFAVGQMVAADVDYSGQSGFVGSGVSAAYVRSAASVQSDANYIRRVSFNVARVLAVQPNGLELAQPLIAGVPTAGMRVQPIAGFVDREGGCFFQEWSALFVMQGEQGERILYHYPRLQAMAGAAEAGRLLAGALEAMCLSAEFRSMPVTDCNDGEHVLCYRSFLPGAMMPPG